MQIKTITCHDVYNFGASLQAYALQTFLQKQGHEVEIIDYIPTYKHFYELFRLYDMGIFGRIMKICPFIEPILALIQHRNWIKRIPMFWRYRRFKSKMLNCTKRKYKSIEDLKQYKPKADIFIAGSDQIWNTAFMNGLDPAYYCMFESDSNKCVTYAASFGISSIPENHIEFVKKGLANFRSISIREKSGVELAKRLGFEAENVLDPVFLLSKKEWESLIKKRHKEKYLLVYDFANNDRRMEEIAVKIAKERGLKIYSFNSIKTYIEKTLFNCGPIQFLEWIAGADMVVSNSFHATAFSTIFERDFYTIPLKGHGNSSRMKDYLESIDLESRYIENVEYVMASKHIDYYKYRNKMNDQREKSKEWLLDSINI